MPSQLSITILSNLTILCPCSINGQHERYSNALRLARERQKECSLYLAREGQKRSPNAAYELLVALKCSEAGTALNIPQSDCVVRAARHHQPSHEGHDEVHVGRD